MPPGKPVFQAHLKPLASAEIFNDQPVVAFAGIARPRKFYRTLQRMNVSIRKMVAYPDHHVFTPADLTYLQAKAKEHGARLVTTTKDYVRLPGGHAGRSHQGRSRSGVRRRGRPAEGRAYLMLRTIRYTLQAIGILTGLAFFRLLPLDAASAFGGWLGNRIGPLTRAHKTAHSNLERVMPELSQAERQKILRDMWNNLGRVIGEYPHLSRPLMRRRIIIEGREHLERVKTSGKGSLFISGHFANWEIAPITASLCGLPLVLIYRAANNPFSDRIIRYIRSRYNHSMYGKGREGAQASLKALKEKLGVGMLVDQKMNDGSPIPFMGHEAMTATAAAQMAIRFQVPIILARVVRLGGAHFHVTMMPAVQYAPDTDARAAMLELHHHFERWIRERPAQWFWVHNRWSWK